MSKLAKALRSVTGTATAGGGLNVEDVFSTYLYTGTGSTLNIVNGIDLAGEGGLVWHKYRGGISDHGLFDTERGVSRKLSSNNTDAQTAALSGYGITAFNSDGYTLGTQYSGENGSGNEVASWTFRKAPKFFDVVTYTGTGVAQNISHSLGSVPGMVVVKNITTGGANSNWTVWHNGLSDNSKFLRLNTTDAEATASNQFNGTAPTSTVFSVGTSSNTNANGDTYVAYLFAHNDGDGEFGPTGDQDIIKCGSYTGAGTTDVDVDLGFEPQWVLIKKSSASGDQWLMLDNMRGTVTGGNDNRLFANLSNSEAANDYLEFTSTGFRITGSSGDVATSGATYIYIAIRRGPMAVPESATDVFDIATRDATHPSFDASFDTVDFSFVKNSATTGSWRVFSRLQGQNYMSFDSTNAENTYALAELDYMDGWSYGVGTASTFYSWMWKRAPNYFDAVAYTGNGTAGRTVSHNLGVAPEMMWVKNRIDSVDWWVYHKDTGATKRLYLNQVYAALANSTAWNDTAPTDSVFTVGTSSQTNGSGDGMIAYLFASLDGISKVGSYVGNGTSQTIDCGFSSGARFVLIKCSSHTGPWQVFDTERGIVVGADKILELDSSNAEYTYAGIDPTPSGFIVNDNVTNESGRTFIFYAIA